MKCWMLPITYFSFCEILNLLYELGLAGIIKNSIWVTSSLILVILVSPVIGMSKWVEQQIAALLNVPFGQHQFWPRLLSTQFSIVTCTLIFTVFCWLVTKKQNQK